jgi:hypothetical protein
MNSKEFLTRGIVNTIILTTVLALFATMGASIAEAREVRAAQPQTEAAYPSFDSYTPSREALSELGLNEEEIDFYLNLEDSGITVADGVAYDEDGNMLDVQTGISTFGRLSWVVNILSKVFNRLPSSMKRVLIGWTGFRGILRFIEHWTGSIESGVFWGCMHVINQDTACWWVTKTLMAFL